jgi:hypothetical protein
MAISVVCTVRRWRPSANPQLQTKLGRQTASVSQGRRSSESLRPHRTRLPASLGKCVLHVPEVGLFTAATSASSVLQHRGAPTPAPPSGAGGRSHAPATSAPLLFVQSRLKLLRGSPLVHQRLTLNISSVAVYRCKYLAACRWPCKVTTITILVRAPFCSSGDQRRASRRALRHPAPDTCANEVRSSISRRLPNSSSPVLLQPWQCSNAVANQPQGRQSISCGASGPQTYRERRRTAQILSGAAVRTCIVDCALC